MTDTENRLNRLEPYLLFMHGKILQHSRHTHISRRRKFSSFYFTFHFNMLLKLSPLHYPFVFKRKTSHTYIDKTSWQTPPPPQLHHA